MRHRSYGDSQPHQHPHGNQGEHDQRQQLAGLQLDNCSFLTITGNTIADSGSRGVGDALNANYITFTGNTVLRSRRNGLNLAHITDWVISGNMILNNGTNLVNRFGLALDASGGACERLTLLATRRKTPGQAPRRPTASLFQVPPTESTLCAI